MGLPITITPDPGRWRVRLGDLVLGETAGAVNLVEAGRSPVLYVPRADMDIGLFTPTERVTTCPWKGRASYFSVGGVANVVWCYQHPLATASGIAGYLAFYPEVTVERVV